MAVNVQNDQANTPEQPKVSEKEVNFRKQEELFKRQLEQERVARLQAEQEREELKNKIQQAQSRDNDDDDEQDDEPYVDKRKLSKKLSKFEQLIDKKIEAKAEEKARKLMDDERKNSWLRNNPDFYDIMQHAQTLADKHPDVAESILEMPESFARQQLVYKNIKALGLHKPVETKPTIQDKIDQNRKSPYYQPSGVGTAPYSTVGDFSDAGQKNAYAKMKDLQKRLRIG